MPVCTMCRPHSNKATPPIRSRRTIVSIDWLANWLVAFREGRPGINPSVKAKVPAKHSLRFAACYGNVSARLHGCLKSIDNCPPYKGSVAQCRRGRSAKEMAVGTIRLALAFLFILICLTSSNGQETLGKIKTIVVIYAENRSFDHLYGFFPGANGIANATAEQKTQLDHDGSPLPYLTIFGSDGKPHPRFPRMPNEPFSIEAAPINMPADMIASSPIHAFYHNQEQINGGKNNMFAAMSTVGGWVMGYFDGSQLRVWQWAKEYTLADSFFMGAFGGSYLNHFWLVCACTPKYPDADRSPAQDKIAVVESDGVSLKLADNSPKSAIDGVPKFVRDGTLTPDFYSVNTMQPPYQPSANKPAKDGDSAFADPAIPTTLPPQAEQTIGDLLSTKGIGWAWYAGAWQA